MRLVGPGPTCINVPSDVPRTNSPAAGVQLVFAATALVLRAAAMTGRGIGKSAGTARGRGRSASKQAASRLNKPGRASDVNPVAPEPNAVNSNGTGAQQFADDDPQVQGSRPEIRSDKGEKLLVEQILHGRYVADK